MLLVSTMFDLFVYFVYFIVIIGCMGKTQQFSSLFLRSIGEGIFKFCSRFFLGLGLAFVSFLARIQIIPLHPVLPEFIVFETIWPT